MQTLASLGIQESPEACSYHGRAQAPDFVLKPLMSRPRIAAESLQVPGGYGATARLWATGRARSAKLRATLKRNATESEVCVMRARIVALSRRTTSGFRSAWEAIDNGADMAAGLIAIMTAGSPSTSIEMIEQAISAFERLERMEVQRGRELASQSFHRWLSKALAGGARQAHL